MAGWLPISSVASLMAEFNCYQAVIKNANILFIKPSLSKTHGQHSHASRLRDAHTDYHQRHALFCGFLGKVLCACYPAFTAGKDASDQSFDRSCKYDRPFLLPLFLKSWTTDEWWKKKNKRQVLAERKIAESDLLNTCQYSNERKFIHQYKLSLSFFVCLFFFFSCSSSDVSQDQKEWTVHRDHPSQLLVSGWQKNTILLSARASPFICQESKPWCSTPPLTGPYEKWHL